MACLMCKSRPKFKQYHLCGKTCKQLSTKHTPLILEAPEGHATWDMGTPAFHIAFFDEHSLFARTVQKKFDSAWKYGTKPQIKKIYKIIESKNFLQPYDKYKFVATHLILFLIPNILFHAGKRSEMRRSGITAHQESVHWARMAIQFSVTIVDVLFAAF